MRSELAHLNTSGKRLLTGTKSPNEASRVSKPPNLMVMSTAKQAGEQVDHLCGMGSQKGQEEKLSWLHAS